MARSAIVTVHPHWLTLTLVDREARCDSSRLTENDLGIQLLLPSGPQNDFYSGRDFPIELRLPGAGGISRVSPGYVVAHIEDFQPEKDENLQGFLSFRYRTGKDPEAPSYISEGPFTARVCNNQPTQASVRSPQFEKSLVSGKVAGRPIELRTMLVYLRDNGFGASILLLKGYSGDVPCHTKRSATPYLFGAEIGPGRDGNYVLGKPLPTDWNMQMRMDGFSERSVQAGHGSSWVQLDSVELQEGGQVLGRLVADNPDDDPEWSFSLSGKFEAKVCGIERKAW